MLMSYWVQLPLPRQRQCTRWQVQHLMCISWWTNSCQPCDSGSGIISTCDTWASFLLASCWLWAVKHMFLVCMSTLTNVIVVLCVLWSIYCFWTKHCLAAPVKLCGFYCWLSCVRSRCSVYGFIKILMDWSVWVSNTLNVAQPTWAN